MSIFKVHPEYQLVNINFESQPQIYQSEDSEDKNLQQKKPVQTGSISTTIQVQDSNKENEEVTNPLDILFPYVKWPQENDGNTFDYNRIFDLSFSVLFFIGIISIKFYIAQNFNLSTFCDVQK